MSVGAWVLLIFGVFSAVSFVEALAWPRGLAQRLEPWLSGGFGRVFMGVGALFGLLLAGYPGVLLSVSNQPIWSDTWALGGLFLASGLSVAAAAIGLAVRVRPDAGSSEEKLARAYWYFLLLELALLVVFFLTLGALASRLFEGRLILLWVLVLIGTLVPLVIHVRSSPGRRAATVLASWLVLVGGLALRIVVIFGAQM
jgi:formate-dependent nitrite reductase membrane component NrfD